MSSNRPVTYDDLFGKYAESRSAFPNSGTNILDLRPNTTAIAVVREDQMSFHVFLYGSLIAVVWRDEIVFSDGGHRTNTTKNRLNDLLIPHGWKIKSIEGAWKIVNFGGSAPIRDFYRTNTLLVDSKN